LQILELLAIYPPPYLKVYSVVYLPMEDLRRLLNYVRPYWGSFVFALIAMAAVAIFETATATLLAPIFDQFAPNPERRAKIPFDIVSLIPKNDWIRGWIVISILLIGFTIAKGVAEFVSSFLMARIGQKAVLRLRKDLYEHLLSQSAGFFERHRTNFLVTRLVVNCSAIENAVSTNIRDAIRESLVLVCFIAAAFYFNWRLMLGALIIGPVVVFLTIRFSNLFRRFAAESYEGNKLLSDVAQETLSNQTIVKAYQAEEREKDRFGNIAGIIARANMRTGRIASLSPPTLEFIGYVAIVVLFFFGLREINAERMVASEFFTFIFLLFRSYDPIRRLSRQHNELSKAIAAARDVWDVLDETDVLPEKPNAVSLGPLREKIEFRDVSFRYGTGDRSVLRSIDLTVPVGSTVALVGESGGGKSSLIKLVQRLYDPLSGSVTWDGVDLRDAETRSLRRQIAVVSQETILFNDTVRFNISYGKPDASDDEIVAAAKTAFADGFISELPDGYDTLVGERGVFLSGGQRQRIAIARAVLKGSPVLILDEATSALDTESETLVQRALANLMQGKTSIVIAHRLSTIRKADKIVLMEKGVIVEAGTHWELISLDGKYRKLYELQFDESESEITAA
jgi:ATP-binding cassette, subfamily B, bacterial MsbA